MMMMRCASENCASSCASPAGEGGVCGAPPPLLRRVCSSSCAARSCKGGGGRGGWGPWGPWGPWGARPRPGAGQLAGAPRRHPHLAAGQAAVELLADQGVLLVPLLRGALRGPDAQQARPQLGLERVLQPLRRGACISGVTALPRGRGTGAASARRRGPTLVETASRKECSLSTVPFSSQNDCHSSGVRPRLRWRAPAAPAVSERPIGPCDLRRAAARTWSTCAARGYTPRARRPPPAPSRRAQAPLRL
jgi:hypothetical protein